MLFSLFINACIMISFITIAYLVFSHEKIKALSLQQLEKWLVGLSSGVVGVILMANSYHVSDTLIIDFRNFTLAISAIFGGPVSVALTIIVMLTYRIAVFGITPVTISFLFSLILLGTGSLIVINNNRLFFKNWVACFLVNMFVSTFFMLYWLHMEKDLHLLLLNYYGGSLVLSYTIFKILDAYIRLTGDYNRMAEESTTDFLTKLNNVRGFDIEFNKAINHCSRRNERLSFLMIDIDFFKKINDSYGHAAGDKILNHLAEILLNTCRPFDVISRNGGEEFSVILQDCPQNHAFEVAERIRQAVENFKFPIKSGSINLTISIGVSSYPEMTEDTDVLIEYADKALYQAKQTGRNKVVVYRQ